MTNKNMGWISLNREIRDHWIFKEKRNFSKFEAWIDLLLLANHQDNKILMDNKLIKVEEGSLITSKKKLCERWGWSSTKIKRVFELLEEEKMIVVKCDNKKTTIKILNYKKYQKKITKNIDIDTNLKQNTKEDIPKKISKKYQKNINNNVPNKLIKQTENSETNQWYKKLLKIGIHKKQASEMVIDLDFLNSKKELVEKTNFSNKLYNPAYLYQSFKNYQKENKPEEIKDSYDLHLEAVEYNKKMFKNQNGK